MLIFVVRRVVATIPVLLVVSVVVFMLVHLTPGDPARVILGAEAPVDQVAALREDMGLNQPILLQYWDWLIHAVQGDLGTSIFMQQPVTEVLAERIGPTASLAIAAELIIVVVAVPLGIAAARRPGGFMDRSVMVVALVGMGIPSFVLAIFLVLVFGVILQVLPTAGWVEISDGLGEYLSHLVLPAIALAVILSALVARMTRGSMMDVLSENFVQLARSIGMGETRIVYREVLRNASLPIITVLGTTFGSLITGAVVTETVFNIPGIGQLVVDSIDRRDYPVIQGVVLLGAVLYVGLNLLIDLLYGILDPRVRLTAGKV
ncbi:ABC transporter permease [Brevibacterium sp. CFH 10365]|uniref:ABC transporter permease n=1 Tax=Brevibacterium sp. CFH 10365 TaxID=2585207 RepID=UPI0012665109|nr:ABC transporter permease [Brevibacterium sp. CFH 10365]